MDRSWIDIALCEPFKRYKDWMPETKIPRMHAKVVYQEETVGKYGPGVHNHITDGSGNILVLTTWRTHIDDLQLDKTYIIKNAVVDHFRPPDSWYQKYPWVNEDSYWMSLPYEDGKAYETDYIIQEQYTTYPGNSRMPSNTWNYECY